MQKVKAELVQETASLESELLKLRFVLFVESNLFTDVNTILYLCCVQLLALEIFILYQRFLVVENPWSRKEYQQLITAREKVWSSVRASWQR